MRIGSWENGPSEFLKYCLHLGQAKWLLQLPTTRRSSAFASLSAVSRTRRSMPLMMMIGVVHPRSLSRRSNWIPSMPGTTRSRKIKEVSGLSSSRNGSAVVVTSQLKSRLAPKPDRNCPIHRIVVNDQHAPQMSHSPSTWFAIRDSPHVFPVRLRFDPSWKRRNENQIFSPVQLLSAGPVNPTMLQRGLLIERGFSVSE